MAAQQYEDSREPDKPTSEMKIVAQDPAVLDAEGRPLMATVNVPTDRLADGPRGHRFRVIDFDASTCEYHEPRPLESPDPKWPGWGYVDPYADVHVEADQLLGDAGRDLRCQNVYAIASRTLAVFESALGRRCPWGFESHEINLVPHAFAEANAYYSRDDQALYFGYFGNPEKSVYTCLSHDIVAHETAHAVLDGLRPRLMEPGLHDQRAFHEGFADIVALLSVFSIEGIVEHLLGEADAEGRISVDVVEPDAFAKNPLFKLAEQLGDELADQRGNGLRNSVNLKPGSAWRNERAYREPHRRGEVLVAAMMRTLLAIWVERLKPLAREGQVVDRQRVAEEGAKAAEHLLRMAIRGIDYSPPAEFEFEDYVAAVLRSDQEVSPNDPFEYRARLQETFAEYDIEPATYDVIDLAEHQPVYSGVNFEALRSGQDEMFRFIWANAVHLGISVDHSLRVLDVRPTLRFGPDGLMVSEFVATYYQELDSTVSELRTLSLERDGAENEIVIPGGLKDDVQISISGGGTLVFNQFGMLKYHCPKPLLDWRRQERRLQHMVARGEKGRDGRVGFSSGASAGQTFAALHVPESRLGEDW